MKSIQVLGYNISCLEMTGLIICMFGIVTIVYSNPLNEISINRELSPEGKY